MDDTDKLHLADYIRKYGGSVREYGHEHANVTYIEITAATGGGTRLDGHLLASRCVADLHRLLGLERPDGRNAWFEAQTADGGHGGVRRRRGRGLSIGDHRRRCSAAAAVRADDGLGAQ